jgi:hypothetical protein
MGLSGRQEPSGATDQGGVPHPRALLTLLALLLLATVIAGCGAEEADSGSPEASAATNASAAEGSEEPRVPQFCADEEARGQANLLFQLLPQIAASPDGGKSQFETPIFTGPDFDAVGRHLDAVESAPASEADAGGDVKSRYVEAMRGGVDAYLSAKQGDASKLATASPAVTDAYLAFATPYACS